MATQLNNLLIRKYNTAVPRYTSYPTVPFWKDQLTVDCWLPLFQSKFEAQNHRHGISLYIHLPFCETLCTYCGCNKKITTNHSVEDEYLDALEKEWLLYRKLMKQTPVIREIHLGGGTPTFFSAQNLKRLLKMILKQAVIHPRHEFSIEGHPNNTTKEHLKVLYALGFRRISYGVQDNDPQVQRIINRIQPFENVKAATENARAAGFTSVNFDLIYGLPLQTTESIERTFSKVLELKPDRIAFYSYAHVPWTARAQRLFDESHLPGAEEKLRLYLTGKEILLDNGYTDIGMDHFALQSDSLYKSWRSGSLHRNFMGYTNLKSGLLLGLGVSAISDIGSAYAQNHKALHDYYTSVRAGLPAVSKGCILTATDMAFRSYILDISCRGETTFDPAHLPLLKQNTFPKLTELEKDGLITWNSQSLNVTATGHYFIRNICSAFDLYMNGVAEQNHVFSKAI